MSTPSITCPQCRMTSYNPEDVTRGYCGHCYAYTGAVEALVNRLPFDEVANGMYHDRQGHPITLARWTWLMEPSYNPDWWSYHSLGNDHLPDGIRVSTVWDGVSMLPKELAPPHIFETVIFVDGRIESGQRYTTEAEALATHATLVRSLQLVGRDFLKTELETPAAEVES